MKTVKFKVKSGHYLKLLTPGIMKLLGSKEEETTKNKNAKKLPALEITK